MLRGPSGERGQEGARPHFAIVIPGPQGDLRGQAPIDCFRPGHKLNDTAFPFYEGEAGSSFPMRPRRLKYLYAGCFEGRLVIHGCLYDRCAQSLPGRYAEVLVNLAAYLNALVLMTGRAVCLYGPYRCADDPGTPRWWSSRKRALWAPDRRPTRHMVVRHRGRIKTATIAAVTHTASAVTPETDFQMLHKRGAL